MPRSMQLATKDEKAPGGLARSAALDGDGINRQGIANEKWYSEGVASHPSPQPSEGGTEREPIVFDFGGVRLPSMLALLYRAS